MLCVLILYISGETYSLKSTVNDRFFEKLLMTMFYLLSEFLPQICWEEIAEEIEEILSGLGLISQHTTY